MKTKLSSGQSRGLLPAFVHAAILAVILLHAQPIFGVPRGPAPPFPEQLQAIHYQGFDADYWAGDTNDQIVTQGFVLNESWSGYALARTGDSLVPFVIPALDSATGHTNISSDTGGALQLWVRPYWSSQSEGGGIGPGTNATLLELDALNGLVACAWSLEIGADGNTVTLFNQTGAGLQPVLQAPIAWQAGTSHLVCLNYGPQATTLYLDGAMAAQGAGVASVPPSVSQLVLGSTLSGMDTAGADLDEFCSFAHFLTDFDVASYYGFTAPEAALGPISAEEEAMLDSVGFQMDSIRSPGNVFDPNNATPCSPGGPVYMTNFAATLLSNGTTTVSFTIQGGADGVLYDIFETPSLNNNLADYQWTWIGEGMTCNSYSFTNQPADQAFYVLELPAETFTVAFGDDSYGQIDVPYGLSNAIAVAGGESFSLALRNDGTVIGWGDDTHGQTDVPAGLSNVVAIAAGEYHGVALLADGSVTNWGTYFGGFLYYSSVTNRSLASAPPTSGVVAVAAGDGQDLALMSNGTCVAWGFTNVYGTGAASGTRVPADLNLTNVAAIACGWGFNVVLSSNGAVTAWGAQDYGVWNPTNVPSDLTSNVVAIAAGGLNSVALRNDGTVEAWGSPDDGVTDVPSGLSNVVAVATGGQSGLALRADGTVVAWGLDSSNSIPTGVLGVKAISAGFEHNLVIESGMLNPVIFTQPSDQYALAGGTVTFSAQGEGVAGVQYQWQFNGVDMADATNATLTLTDTQATNQGNYQVIISADFGSISSSVATFTIIDPPQIGSTTPQGPGVAWIANGTPLSVTVTNVGLPADLISYQWQFNGANISNALSSSYQFSDGPPTAANEGAYTVVITDTAGGTNMTWNARLALPGMAEAWGDDEYGECDRPVTLTNASSIAAGEYQSVAVTSAGTVVQWGQYWDGPNFYPVTNSAVATQPPASNVVAVAAGPEQALALMNDGTVRAWGLIGAYGTHVPASLSGVKAITCGWSFNVALLTNSTVTAWGYDDLGDTDVPDGLTNVTAIAAGGQHALALLSDGTVQAWGDGFDGDTDIPTGLANVVAIAAGESHNLALKSDGTVVAWGLNDSGQTNVPAGLSNVMAVAAGANHSVALLNDGITLVEWGDNTYGQTNVPSEQPTTQTNTYPPIMVKLLAAGGDHTMAAIFSPLMPYPIDVSKDLLLLYNTNSIDSSNVCQYYLAHRPMVSGANVLGIDCTTNAVISPSDFTNLFQAQVQNWLWNNPTKRPLYVVLFQDLPQEVHWWTNSEATAGGSPSVQYQLHYWTWPEWSPLITAINMNGTDGTNYFSSDGTNDCIAYINKLTNMANSNPPGTLYISASAGGYGNTNWYFDEEGWGWDLGAIEAITNADPFAVVYESNVAGQYSPLATNVAGYRVAGCDGGMAQGFATNGDVKFVGNSGWFIMSTVDSFNGQRESIQSSYLTWFATNAFGGANYANTPVGAITHVDEPGGDVDKVDSYCGNWAAGRSFGSSAWAASFQGAFSGMFQAVGDPFVKK